MQPQVFIACGLERQNIVFFVVAADENGHAVCECVFIRFRLILLFAEPTCLLAAAQITGFDQFCTQRLNLLDVLGVFQKGEHGFQIVDLIVVFRELDLLFLDGCLCLGVFLEVVLGVFGRCQFDIQRDLDFLAVVIVDDADGAHARLHQMQVCGQEFAEQPQIFGILRLEQILGETFFLQVHLIEARGYGADQIMRFLAALIGGSLFGKIGFERGTHAAEGPRFTACGIVCQRDRIEFHRMLLVILVNISGRYSCLDLCADCFKIGSTVCTCVQGQFSGKGRSDTADRLQDRFAVLRQGSDRFRRDLAERRFVLCRRILIDQTRQDLPYPIDIEGDPLDGIDDLAARQIDQHDIAVLAHDLEDQFFGNRKAELVQRFQGDLDDAFRIFLPDIRDAAALQMLAQQHAE